MLLLLLLVETLVVDIVAVMLDAVVDDVDGKSTTIHLLLDQHYG